MDTYSVGDIAQMAGISVRTLHHYDEIGLLIPVRRTESGYRVYDDVTIDRLRTILTYRSLGLGLNEIAMALDSEDHAMSALEDARTRVLERIEHLQAIAANLTQTIQGTDQGEMMKPEEKLSVFGDFDPSEYSDEAQDRWGATTAYAESMRRTKSYTSADWETMAAEMDSINKRLAIFLADGVSPAAPEVSALVDEHRKHISRWFYECTPQFHAGLGQMYAADPRFRKNLDRSGEGLAEYLSNAIFARYA